MNTPPLLIGATFLFWGWQTGLWIPGACMALISEGSRLIRWKWDLSPKDFHHIADLCSLLVAGMAVYVYASDPNPRTIMVIIQRLPMVSFPLLAAQLYSTRGKVSMGALFWSLRKARPTHATVRPSEVNITYPFLTGCVLSAGAVQAANPWFYTGLLGLGAWGLWSFRSRRITVPLWIGLLAAAGILGYFGHLGLHDLQGVVERKATAWFSSWMREDTDPISTRTAVGDLGTLKLSDRILFRIRMESGRRPPPLLHKASYDVFRAGSWFATSPDFQRILPVKDGMTWQLAVGNGPSEFIRISLPLKKGKGLLNLPTGSVEIAELPAPSLEKNRFGTVKIEEGPGLISYRVGFRPGGGFEGPVTDADLAVPVNLRLTLEKILRDLHLSPATPPGEIQEKISAFFKQDFSYSLVLNTDARGRRTIEDFLTRSKKGHCEYFAVASTLLLRTAGLPARYATGYSVQEFSGLEKRFIVRQRHAHAWTRVYRNGAWHDFDTTPSTWLDIEGKNASFLEPLYDLWSWGTFKLSEWRWIRRQGTGMGKHLLWFLIPLTLLLIRRLGARKRVPWGEGNRKSRSATSKKNGRDSAFFLVEKALNEKGHIRGPGETYTAWIDRLQEMGTEDPTTYKALRTLLDLHYRYRFDPMEITEAERSLLRSGVEQWMMEHGSPVVSKSKDQMTETGDRRGRT